MEYILGVITGIILIGVIRLLELKYGVTTDSLSHHFKPRYQKAEFLIPEATPDDIADQIVKSQQTDTSIIPDI
jgi:hypothetical protein